MTIFNYSNVQLDPFQQAALVSFESIANQLEEVSRTNISSWLFTRKKHINGIYLWGGVGIGKTYLMDYFYQGLSFQKKLRIHFFKFMQMIHEQLAALQGKKNPLELIAKNLARDYLVICFDEFIVTDIVDAMVLANLLKALFTEKVTLVFTSNTAPDDLYYRGLQRDKFLPAIELIKAKTNVIHMVSSHDYRTLNQQDSAENALPKNMLKYFPEKTDYQYGETIEIAQRHIKVISRSEDTVWFSFKNICSPPRSPIDYLTIAQKYKTILVSDIPPISSEEKNTIRLLIALVDIFYDAGIHFIFSTQVPIESIYTAGDMAIPFMRTKSRLIEFQSKFSNPAFKSC